MSGISGADGEGGDDRKMDTIISLVLQEEECSGVLCEDEGMLCGGC